MTIADYRPNNVFDEMVDPRGRVQPYYKAVADQIAGMSSGDLEQKVKSLELLFLKQGVTFTVYGDQQGTERVFPFDPFPRVIPASEW